MKTRITELLGIQHPIIQAPMGVVASPALAAAVSDAGGLGILGAGSWTAEELEQGIREVRRRTGKPFGVNVHAASPHIEDLSDVILKERVAVVSYGRGNPSAILGKCKSAGIICMPTIGALSHAIKAEEDGADAVIAQGFESGGHCSFVATNVLVPLVASRLKIPVAAAGGFCDGKGLMAALALGAEGVAMGTRFILTRESLVPSAAKERLLQATEEEAVVTSKVTGTRCRALKNRLLDLLEERGEEVVGGVPKDFLNHVAWGRKMAESAYVRGDIETGFMPCGQVVGRIDDIPTCKELIDAIMAQAEESLESINRYFNLT